MQCAQNIWFWLAMSAGCVNIAPCECTGQYKDGTLPTVDEDPLAQAAALLRERNAIHAELAWLIQRPMTSGHLSEWIGAQAFDIELEGSDIAAGIDGCFRSGPLLAQTVNIKWYLKREGLLDTAESTALDYYLVLTGPPSAEISSRAQRGPGASKPFSSLIRGNFGPSRSRAG